MMLRFLLPIFLLAAPAVAQTSAPIFVSPGTDRDEETACDLTHSSAVAALQAGLRYNNIPIAYARDGKSLTMEVTLVTVELAGGNCATSPTISLYEPRRIFSAVTKSSHDTVIEFCFRNAIITGRTTTLQERVNATLKEMLDLCLADYGAHTH